MTSSTIATRPQKMHFSETEAAHELGITLDQFRTLIRQHITYGQEEDGNITNTIFQPSDLLLLRFLSGPLRERNAALRAEAEQANALRVDVLEAAGQPA